MAFWGVEVKPGKPYTHTHQADHGRLRICQATLGNCDAASRTVLQCNVGNKIPIKLCSINPKLAEMCRLEIEFEEVDDVVFSVIGQSSIHLSGYYVHARSKSNMGDDESESYGEDIEHSDPDEEHDAGEDSYESDFIDDREVPVPEKYGSDSIEDSDDECTIPRHHKQKASEKPTRKAERRRRLKKYQADSTDDNDGDTPVTKPVVKRSAASIFESDSDDDITAKKPIVKRSAPIFDSSSDEEDNVPISVALGKKDNAKVTEETNPQNGLANEVTRKNAKKRKSSAISEDPAPSVDVIDANAPSVSKQGAEIKKKSKKKRHQSGEKDEKKSNIRILEDGLKVEDLSTGNIDAKVASDGCKVYIKYVGMLNGETVESNAGEKPYKFKLGAGKVIRGWDVGIRGMHVGEKRRLTVPPSMLCGGKSAEVPKSSSVVYEIELVKVK